MPLDWRTAERDLRGILARHYSALTARALADVGADLGRAVTPDERALAFIADSAADRAQGMIATQRDRLDTIRATYADDPEAYRVALTEAEHGAARYGAMVGRSETTWAYNNAVVVAVQADGAAQLYCTDGDGDAVCAEVNDTYVTAEWALENPLGHPSCTRRFIATDGP